MFIYLSQVSWLCDSDGKRSRWIEITLEYNFDIKTKKLVKGHGLENILNEGNSIVFVFSGIFLNLILKNFRMKEKTYECMKGIYYLLGTNRYFIFCRHCNVLNLWENIK